MAGIVVGVDGSDNSLDALLWAAREAKLRDVSLNVITCFASAIMSTGYEFALPDRADFTAASQTMLEAALDSVRDSVDLDSIRVHTEVVEGHAGEQLIQRSENAILVVVGSRGHGGFVGLLLGSVTNHVVNHAKCPVVVVR